jgi:hypothetical protein
LERKATSTKSGVLNAKGFETMRTVGWSTKIGLALIAESHLECAAATESVVLNATGATKD